MPRETFKDMAKKRRLAQRYGYHDPDELITIEMQLEKRTMTEISELLQIDLSTLYLHLKRLGLKTPRKKRTVVE